jgi:hypothetical protein
VQTQTPNPTALHSSIQVHKDARKHKGEVPLRTRAGGAGAGDRGVGNGDGERGETMARELRGRARGSASETLRRWRRPSEAAKRVLIYWRVESGGGGGRRSSEEASGRRKETS